MEILISFVAGMILSGGAVYLLLRAHMRQAKEEARTYAQELLSAKEQAHREAMASLESHHQQALLSEQQRYEEMLAKVSAEMKATTEQMLRQRQSELQESNSLHMQQIVSPLKDTIQRMETALKENRSTQETSTEAIKEKIATLVSTTMKVSDSAERLSNALTAENKTQGNWGEQKIESLLTSIGLERGLE